MKSNHGAPGTASAEPAETEGGPVITAGVFNEASRKAEIFI